MIGATFIGPNGGDPAQHFATIMLAVQPTEADVLVAGQYLRGQIRKRSFAGQDLRGGGFIPYRPSYIKRKGTSKVDLYSRGASRHMLDALTVKTGTTEAAEGMAGSDTPASYVDTKRR